MRRNRRSRSLEPGSLACKLVEVRGTLVLVRRLALVGSLVGSSVERMFVLGSSCRIECGGPTMGRCISGKLACGILVPLGGKLVQLGSVVVASRRLVLACSLGLLGTRSARLHHCRLGRMGCS